MRSRALGLSLVLSALTAAGVARAESNDARSTESADDPSRWLKELDVEAGLLEADLPLRELELRGGVRVRLSPYYLRSDRIHLSLSPWGVRVVGQGELSFCPCEAPPLTIGFAGGWAAPPDELIVESPTLRLFGVPIFWLPYLWLRSPRKVGLEIPEVSVRGRDGVFFGESLHVPVGRGLELGAGFYVRGGFASSLDFVTDTTFTRARLDLRNDPSGPSGVGLSLDAWGVLGGGGHAAQLAWDVDAVRGPRGVRTVLDLEPLARPYDRGVVEGSLGPVAIGVEATDARSSAFDRLDTFTPYASIGGGGTIGSIGAIRGSLDAGPRFVRGAGGDMVVDGGARLALAGPTWPVTWSSSLSVDARGGRPFGTDDAAAEVRGGAVVGEARLEMALPLARALDVDRARGGPPVLHVIEPLVRGALVGAWAEGPERLLVGFPAAALLDPSPTELGTLPSTYGVAGAAAAGVRTSLGTLGGGIAPGRDPFVGALHGELVGGGLALGGRRDAAIAGALAFDEHHEDGGGVDVHLDGVLARPLEGDERSLEAALLGVARAAASRDGLGVEVRAAVRSELAPLGVFALLGRDLAPWIASPAWLAQSGTTAGMSGLLPLGRGVALSAGADGFTPSLRDPRSADVSLLDVHGTLRYRHPCGCFRMSLRGAHVMGRDGIDVFATVELAQRAPDDPRNAIEW